MPTRERSVWTQPWISCRTSLLVFLVASLVVGCTGAGLDEGLREELMERRAIDQAIRDTLARSLQRGEDPDSSAWLRMRARDSANSAWLKTVITERGWPGRSLVGAEAAHAAYLIVQHAAHDPEFQEQGLRLLEEASAAGEATAGEVAYLSDRLASNAGRPQLYGTQARIVDGRVQFFPIEDSANVDRLRAEIGLPPLAEYKRQMEVMYAPEPP